MHTIYQAAQRANIMVRGFQGEGTDALGDFFQVSNQITLGCKEEKIIHDLVHIAQQIVKQEIQVREHILEKKDGMLQDKIDTTVDSLEKANKLSLQQALQALSILRMAISMNKLNYDIQRLNSFFVSCQNSHIAKLIGTEEIDLIEETRAKIIKNYLYS